MVEVGVREVKNSLSRYLKRVRAGETVVATDRGSRSVEVEGLGPAHSFHNLYTDGLTPDRRR